MAYLGSVGSTAFSALAGLLLLLGSPSWSVSLPVRRTYVGGISAVEQNDSTKGDNNPFMEPGVSEFMKKFNLEEVHGKPS